MFSVKKEAVLRKIGGVTVAPFASFGIVMLAACPIASANTVCVNPQGSNGCYSKIQTAVDHALANDEIDVSAGTYKEQVVVPEALALVGAGPDNSVIDATGFPNGIRIDGFNNPRLHNVSISGFTVKNALYEGVLVVNAGDVTIRHDHIMDNDKYGAAYSATPQGCPGQPAYETDESGDCGGGLHLIGVVDSLVFDNTMSGNTSGILVTDETGEDRGNVISHNIVEDNALECGIVLASHVPLGAKGPYFAPHWGVDNNTISDNVSKDNGVQVGGAGVGLFSDGAGPGKVSGNLIIRNRLTGNGIGGVSLHSHVGPAFHAPADDMSGNQIIGNYIAGNLADTDDTATPGRVGININSGGGGSPVTGTVISENVIRDEDVDIAINTTAEVDIHLNDLGGGKIGVANICAFDNGANSPNCLYGIDATVNYWGCAAGEGAAGCSTKSGLDVRFRPWLYEPVAGTDE